MGVGTGGENQEELEEAAKEVSFENLSGRGGGRRGNEAFMDNISRYPRDWWELEQAEKAKRKEAAKEVSFGNLSGWGGG